MKKIRIIDGTVAEVFQEPLAAYHPDFLAQGIDAPDEVQPGWTSVDGHYSPPPGPLLDTLMAAKAEEVWAAIRVEMDRHYDQPWQTAASQLNAHYKELLGRDDVPQAVKDEITPAMVKLVQLWAYLLVGSSAAGAKRVAAIRTLTTAEDVQSYTVDLSDWVATDPQITMSQITVPAALAILPRV